MVSNRYHPRDIMKQETSGLRVRIPVDVKEFIEQEAKLNASSQNSEIIRCIREKMERTAKEKGAARS